MNINDLYKIKLKPSMYFGGGDLRGLHNCLFTLLNMAVDEHKIGHGDRIDVVLYPDGTASIRDNGEGLPVEIDPVLNRPKIEVALGSLHTMNPYFRTYIYPTAQPGVSINCVNAVSESFLVEVARAGQIHKLEFQKGKMIQPLKAIQDSTDTGTLITFKPDLEIFKSAGTFDQEVIAKRMQQLAFLCPGLMLTLKDQHSEEERFYFSKGIAEYVAETTAENKILDLPPVVIKHVMKGASTVRISALENGEMTSKLVKTDIIVEIVFQFTRDPKSKWEVFTNCVHNVSGSSYSINHEISDTVLSLWTEKVGGHRWDDRYSVASVCGIISIQNAVPRYEDFNRSQDVTFFRRNLLGDIIRRQFANYLNQNAELLEKVIKVKPAQPQSAGLFQIYNPEDIQLLKGLEAVRQKPGMYLGGSDERAMHHSVFEVMDNSIEEHAAGFGNRIDLILHKDGSLSITDEGRGFSIQMRGSPQIPLVEVVLSKLHSGGKYEQEGEYFYTGTCGVGAKCVNAVSEWFSVEFSREGRRYSIGFCRGKLSQPLRDLGATSKVGSTIRFKPDPLIFKDGIEFRQNLLTSRLRQLAFLNKGLQITLTEERCDPPPKLKTFLYPNGLADYVATFAELMCPGVDSQPISFSQFESGVIELQPTQLNPDKRLRDFRVDIAFQYIPGWYDKHILCFTNTVYNIDLGTHWAGFMKGLSTAIREYQLATPRENSPQSKMTRKELQVGMVAVVSVWHPAPRFGPSTKDVLISPDVEKLVKKFTFQKVSNILVGNPHIAEQIIQHLAQVRTMREQEDKS